MEKRKKTASLFLRLTPQDRALLSRLAEDDRRSVVNWIETQIQKEAKKKRLLSPP